MGEGFESVVIVGGRGNWGVKKVVRNNVGKIGLREIEIVRRGSGEEVGGGSGK